jgi:hypothetical protein
MFYFASSSEAGVDDLNQLLEHGYPLAASLQQR